VPVVHAEQDIPDVTPAQVWAAVADFERYPAVMPNVLAVTFLERDAHTAVSAWRILLEGTEMTWEERDVFEPYHSIRFEQIDGDLAAFRGAWLLTDLGGAVRVRLSLEFDIGIPSLAAVLNPLGAEAIRGNAEEMLAAIRARVGVLERAS
jgi:ribosome-associated toxin RatA of RatAB toxin-antitoxin module